MSPATTVLDLALRAYPVRSVLLPMLHSEEVKNLMRVARSIQHQLALELERRFISIRATPGCVGPNALIAYCFRHSLRRINYETPLLNVSLSPILSRLSSLTSLTELQIKAPYDRNLCISTLTQLQRLTIRKLRCHPYRIGVSSLSHLRTLNLEIDCLNSFTSSFFTHFTTLEQLEIKFIYGGINASAFEGLDRHTNLTSIVLDGSVRVYLPDRILPSLQKLHTLKLPLAGAGHDFSRELSTLTNLQSLTLNAKNCNQKPVPPLSALTRLRKLDLAHFDQISSRDLSELLATKVASFQLCS